MKKLLRKAVLPLSLSFACIAAPVAAQVPDQTHQSIQSQSKPAPQTKKIDGDIGNYRYENMMNLSVNEMRDLTNLMYKSDYTNEVKPHELKNYYVCTYGSDFTLNFNHVAKLPPLSEYNVAFMFRLMYLDIALKSTQTPPELDDFKNCADISDKEGIAELNKLIKSYNDNTFDQILYHEKFIKRLSKYT